MCIICCYVFACVCVRVVSIFQFRKRKTNLATKSHVLPLAIRRLPYYYCYYYYIHFVCTKLSDDSRTIFRLLQNVFWLEYGAHIIYFSFNSTHPLMQITTGNVERVCWLTRVLNLYWINPSPDDARFLSSLKYL